MVQMTYRAAVAQALSEEMERDPNVILLGEDVGRFGGAMAATKGLYDRFGAARVIDTPISEAAIIGTALGASITGLRPVAEIMFMDFTTCCMDQIANQVAKTRYMSGGQVAAPLVIRTQGGAGKSYALSTPRISRPGSPRSRAASSFRRHRPTRRACSRAPSVATTP
jgi:pyruvate dehydrogenase E1 component beta subunit